MPQQDDAFARFSTLPHDDLVRKVEAHVKATGEPETLADLFHGRISKDEKFVILAKVNVPQSRRPNRDYAPCPMCVPNKFLEGRLCWFPRLECVALIGHDCANKENSQDAESEWQRRRREKEETDFLLDHLLLVQDMVAVLEDFRPVAIAARDLFRHFRSKAGSVHRELRHVAKTGAQLSVAEKVWGQLQAVGPSGFGGAAGHTRTITFGPLHGVTAVQRDFDPVRRVDAAYERLKPLLCDDDDAVLAMIEGLDEKERHTAVVFIKEAEREFGKVLAMIKDMRNFFAADNLKRIDAWGTHEDNPHQIRVDDRRIIGKNEIYITGDGARALLSPDPVLWSFQAAWPKAA
ncbi:hypothetical protein GCM10008171_14340 [Methylopila jiangsuensis]|uniref:Uncharacterized protein n=1 Tax=Methylopila jiangsuensis TaxID=586230 RepID=A0A9W6N3C1_9HYPH|nr:hypothetical protein [Methylopila jiangsuensis]MDR6284302.1 hypothetical protein [Methylopila jiangsuensis]GLK76180.1 hypothetical protein GCM10008171_14340 [Methylopila jiangsuensis]